MAERRPNRYLAGPADKDFWACCAKGELRLQRCTQCRTLRYPVSPVCHECLSYDHEWELLKIGRAHV